jgi:Ca-activated chloride channel homolog
MMAPSGAFRPDRITESWFTRRIRLGCGVVLAALLLVGWASLQAQFASSVNVVEVYATVTDAGGNPVAGLTQQDFLVRENGVEQQVTTFAAGEFPLSVAIAIDRSFSMAGTRLASARSAARVFLGALRPADESMVIAIGSATEIVAPLSTDRDAQYAAIAKLEPFGTTGLHDSIVAAVDAVQQARGRRALVLLSDGTDRYSQASAQDALAKVRRSDVLIYPVAFGKERPPLFAELATLTGGRSHHIEDARKLPDTLRAIARELRHQYLLGYSPSRPIVPGSGEWRSITVTARRPSVTVRARDGYVAR